MDNITTTIREKIRKYVLRESMADQTEISNETLIFREGFFDSMGFIKMLTFIEEIFGVKVNDSEMVEENFESINAITEFISRKKQNYIEFDKKLKLPYLF